LNTHGDQCGSGAILHIRGACDAPTRSMNAIDPLAILPERWQFAIVMRAHPATMTNVKKSLGLKTIFNESARPRIAPGDSHGRDGRGKGTLTMATC